jgi:putative phosphoserine phosphatase/1-acylglycerol-3-phosphate O-acyltransferase
VTATQTAAFFDMDRTLLSASSTALWIKYMRARGELPAREVMRYLGALLRYKLDRLDMVELTRRLAKDLAGQLETERVTSTRGWVAEQVVQFVAPEGRRWLAAHRQRGHRVALITASPAYTASALAEHLSIPVEDVMGTRFEVRNGRFTGKMLEPMVIGEGKLAAAQEYAERHGVDLATSYFYTDSIADRPLLEQVGHPVAVNPDRALKQLAQARGWDVVYFY